MPTETADKQQTARRIDTGSQLKTLIRANVRLTAASRKTWILAIVHALPVGVAAIALATTNQLGISIFSQTLRTTTLPLLVPLTALFYGGPSIVDETEGQTLPYLTSRPVPKRFIFIGKWLSAALIAAALVAGGIALLLVTCLGAQGVEGVFSIDNALTIGAGIAGAFAYTAVFALLGAAFESTIASGIIYYLFVEMILQKLPLFEFLSVRFHLQTAIDSSGGGSSAIANFIGIESLSLPPWVGLVTLLTTTVVLVALGAFIFENRQYVH